MADIRDAHRSKTKSTAEELAQITQDPQQSQTTIGSEAMRTELDLTSGGFYRTGWKAQSA